MKRLLYPVTLFTMVFILSASRPVKIALNELYRPQYHFSPERNYMGNPSGLVYLDGEYHMFYQHNPKGNKEGYSHIGHTSSTDLIHWKNLPVAIFPDNLSEDKDFCTALPGSALVDHSNVLGFQEGPLKTLVIFYNSSGCGQRMAYSNNKGETWQKFSGNPVIPYDSTDHAANPKVLWHEPTSKWVMVLYRIPGNDQRKQGFSFYTSENLINWEYQSHLAGFFNSPDLMELRVNNRPEDTRWVITEGEGSYILGSFDGKTFTPEGIRLKSDWGTNYSASQTWSNLPASDGRTIQLAGMTGGEWNEMPFSGQMTFPCELSLKKINTGIFLIRQPVKEIEELYQKEYRWKNENLIPGLGHNLIKKVQGDCLRIKGKFDLKNCESFGLMLRTGKKSQGTELVYNVKRETLSLLGQSVPLTPVDNKIYLDILLDRSSVEVFANNGHAAISCNLFNQENNKGYILYNTGGELLVEELSIFEMKSIWETDK